ncbi:hypothetical protein PENTCL1PPCAC_17131, partial [Pristionchus entomophagus]
TSLPWLIANAPLSSPPALMRKRDRTTQSRSRSSSRSPAEVSSLLTTVLVTRVSLPSPPSPPMDSLSPTMTSRSPTSSIPSSMSIASAPS